MNYNNLIERLEEWNEVCISEMCADDKLTCDDLCGNGDCIVVQAGKAIKELMAEIAEERHRHDRLQDFEVAQAQELERVKAERDAAVEGLASMCECCMVCIHGEETCERNDCEECESKCRCYSCVTGSNFTWKGQQKED